MIKTFPGKTSYTIENEIRLLRGGKDYFTQLTELIRTAKRSIHIRIYLWEEDETGVLIAAALIEAAGKGVQVYAVADGFASRLLSKVFIDKMRSARITFRFFDPLFKSARFYIGRRMHEKVIVIDEETGIVGGINFANRYNDTGLATAWLDYALMVKGAAAQELYRYCMQGWGGKKQLPITGKQYNNPAKCSVRVRYNDWVNGKQQIWKTYFDWFSQANKDIVIICSYFLPGRILRRQLTKAAKKGVRVQVILSAVSDVPITKYAERYLYRWMLRLGIEIYEYQPTVLHAKLMVADKHRVTIGSYNVNNISTYASTEVNLDVRNRIFGRYMHYTLQSLIQKDCIPVTSLSPLVNVSWIKKLLQLVCYQVIRLVLTLSTFYYRQE